MNVPNKSLQATASGQRLRVSKVEFLRYTEAQFDAADVNRDGALDVEELRFFLGLLAHPTISRH